jgi:lysozyme
MLRVIDISVYKRDIDLSQVDFDAVIEKATGGNGYVNEDCDAKIEQAKALNKKWGFFHYYGDGFADNDPISEAEWFVNNCTNYFGKGFAILDWERGGNAQVNDPNAALQFLNHVKERTGITMGIYMSLSLITSMDWSAVIAAGYSLWCAAYVDNNNPITNWQMDPNRDPNPKWDGNVNDVMWQFTSTGRLDGYGGNLDCNFFFGTQASWDAYAGVHIAPPATTTTTTEAVPPPVEATTTTTTVGAPTTDTTTTQLPTATTTTTEASPSQPAPPEAPKSDLWQAIVDLVRRIINRLRGVN